MTFDTNFAFVVEQGDDIDVFIGDFRDGIQVVHLWLLSPGDYAQQLARTEDDGINWISNKRVAIMTRYGDEVKIVAIEDGQQTKFGAPYISHKAVAFTATEAGKWGVLVDGSANVNVAVNTELILTPQKVEFFVGLSGKVSPGNHLDIVITGKSYRATEIAPDLTICRSYVGSTISGGISVIVEPDLTFEQAKIFDLIWKRVEERLEWAKQSGRTIFSLLRFGDNPELFDLQYTRPNIAGNIFEDLRPAWFAVETQLESLGYRVFVQNAPQGLTTGDEMIVKVAPRGTSGVRDQ